MNRILITGNMGYVGPGVVARLRQQFPKAELIGYDLGYFAHCLTGAGRLPETHWDRQVFGDVRHFPDAYLKAWTLLCICRPSATTRWDKPTRP